MTEIYVEGGLFTERPAAFWGHIYCADCEWASESVGPHSIILDRLEGRLRRHRETTHSDGERAP